MKGFTNLGDGHPFLAISDHSMSSIIHQGSPPRGHCRILAVHIGSFTPSSQLVWRLLDIEPMKSAEELASRWTCAFGTRLLGINAAISEGGSINTGKDGLKREWRRCESTSDDWISLTQQRSNCHQPCHNVDPPHRFHFLPSEEAC